MDSGTTAQYSYNHENHRVQKVAGGATIHYVCHKKGVLAEYNGTTGALLVQYVSLGHQQFAKVDNGTTYYYLSDRLSMRLVLDASGNVIGRQTTLPYGEALATDGTTDKRLFTSYERDSEAGNDDAWQRKYAYGVGRFQSADPFKASGGTVQPQSWNRYSYVLNNPVNFIDPTGLFLENPDPELGPPPCTPSPIEPPAKRFPSVLIVEGDSANLAIYIPENVLAYTADDWLYVPVNGSVEADVVGTPRGIVKIPDACTCTLHCSNNWKIHCDCFITRACYDL